MLITDKTPVKSFFFFFLVLSFFYQIQFAIFNLATRHTFSFLQLLSSELPKGDLSTNSRSNLPSRCSSIDLGNILPLL